MTLNAPKAFFTIKICPSCGQPSTVKDSRERKDGSIRRRRVCTKCPRRWTTVETSIEEVRPVPTDRQLALALAGVSQINRGVGIIAKMIEQFKKNDQYSPEVETSAADKPLP